MTHVERPFILTRMSDKKQEELTITEAGVRLGVSARTVRRWCEAGSFPNCYKLNPTNPRSRYRIPLSDIEAFEKQRENM